MQGCLELLRRYNVPISGKRAVVLGRSNIVGMPVAHLLQVRSCSYSVLADLLLSAQQDSNAHAMIRARCPYPAEESMSCVRSCSDLCCACVLQAEDATVTVVHSKTKDAQALCAEADILIAAIGKAEMVKADWVKPGAAVIDVGTNPVPVSPPWLALRRSHGMCMGAGLRSAGQSFLALRQCCWRRDG